MIHNFVRVIEICILSLHYDVIMQSQLLRTDLAVSSLLFYLFVTSTKKHLVASINTKLKKLLILCDVTTAS